MSRKLFTAGCVMLVALGLVHLLGHYALVTNQGDTEQERQLLAMMRSNPRDMGLGFVRTTFEILSGFSLYFSVSSLGLGLLGFALRRHASAAAGLLRQAAIVYAGTYGIMTAVGWRYWFPAPLVFLAAAFVCFAAAAATAPRA
jgi:hypothetical protein